MKTISVSVTINVVLSCAEDISYQDLVDTFQQECDYSFDMPKDIPITVEETEWVETN